LRNHTDTIAQNTKAKGEVEEEKNETIIKAKDSFRVARVKEVDTAANALNVTKE
jgi:hypothetical protein